MTLVFSFNDSSFHLWTNNSINQRVEGCMLANCVMGVEQVPKTACPRGIRPWITGLPQTTWPFVTRRQGFRFLSNGWLVGSTKRILTSASLVLIEGQNAYLLQE